MKIFRKIVINFIQIFLFSFQELGLQMLFLLGKSKARIYKKVRRKLKIINVSSSGLSSATGARDQKSLIFKIVFNSRRL